MRQGRPPPLLVRKHMQRCAEYRTSQRISLSFSLSFCRASGGLAGKAERVPECPRSSGWSAARSDDAAAAADGDAQAPLAVGGALVSVGGRDTGVGCVLAEEATVETEAESPGPKFIHQHQNQCVGLVVYRLSMVACCRGYTSRRARLRQAHRSICAQARGWLDLLLCCSVSQLATTRAR